MDTQTTDQTPSAPAEKSARFDDVIATRSFKAPRSIRRNERDIMTVTLRAYQLGGNSHPYFSATAESLDCGGCLHEEILKVWPTAKPIVDLHLSNADDGVPMHVEGNGYYWLAGAVGGLGERFHGGNGRSAKTPTECLKILANHLRITLDAATTLANQISDVYGSTLTSDKASEARTCAKLAFGSFVSSQRDRWQAEADAGVALIKKFAAERQVTA